MTTKSFALTLNALILFHSTSAGFSCQSLRRKVVTMCRSMSMKVITTLAFLTALLLTLALQGAEVSVGGVVATVGNAVGRVLQPKIPAATRLTGQQPRLSRPLHTCVQGDPLPATVGINPRDQFNQTSRFGFPSVRREPFPPQSQPRPEDPAAQQANPPQPDDSAAQQADQDDDWLPEDLRGSMLDRVPGLGNISKDVFLLINQFAQTDSYLNHYRAQVPDIYSHSALLSGRPDLEYDPKHERIRIEFVDGDPRKLELAFFRNPCLNPKLPHIFDIISIDTKTGTQRTQKDVPIVKYPGLSVLNHKVEPVLYLQNVIGPSDLNFYKQFSYICRRSRWVYRLWRNERSTSSSIPNYSMNSTSEIDQNINNRLFKKGIQRELAVPDSEGRVHHEARWFVPKENKVAIYGWDEGDTRFLRQCITDPEERCPDPNAKVIVKEQWHKDFEPTKIDDDGRVFYLRDVIIEPHQIYSLSVPDAPVILRDTALIDPEHPEKDTRVYHSQNDLWRRLTYGAQTITPHFNKELPSKIPLFAVGFDPKHTNDYVSVHYKRDERFVHGHTEESGNTDDDSKKKVIKYPAKFLWPRSQDEVPNPPEAHLLYQDAPPSTLGSLSAHAACEYERFKPRRGDHSYWMFKHSFKTGAIATAAYMAYLAKFTQPTSAGAMGPTPPP